LDSIPLDSEVKKAILQHEGILGEILESIILYEQMPERFSSNVTSLTGISPSDIEDIYLDALSCTNALITGLIS